MTTQRAKQFDNPAVREPGPWTPALIQRHHRLAVHGMACKQWDAKQPSCGHTAYAPKEPLITLNIGQRRHGKSVSAVQLVADPYAQGVHVVHNGSLNFGENWDLERFAANGYSDALLYIDELEEYLNNLRTAAGMAVDIIGTLIQLGHQQCQIVATTQYPSEIVGRFLRRVDHVTYCYDPQVGTDGAGKRIFQQIVYKPWDNDAPGHGATLGEWWFENPHHYWTLYDHQRFVQVGHGRVNQAQRRAQRETQDKQLIFSLVVNAAVQEIEYVNASELQLLASQHDPMFKHTERTVGRWLASFEAFGLENAGQKNGVRSWRVPAELARFARPDNPAAQSELTEA